MDLILTSTFLTTNLPHDMLTYVLLQDIVKVSFNLKILPQSSFDHFHFLGMIAN